MRMLAALLVGSMALSACTTGGPPPAPTFTPPAEAPGPDVFPTHTAPAGVLSETAPPTPEVEQTAVPELSFTPGPAGTPTLEERPPDCLQPNDYEPIVKAYLTRTGYADLEALWEDFDEDTTSIYGLMSSFTDVTNTFAHATTFSKMLLVGEYKAAVNRPGAVGYIHCAVLVYKSGDDPEFGTGIIDATLNGEWSGYAYGKLHSEQELRQYLQSRIGQPVIARYQVTQDPRDANFVRSGFFSPVMKLLWEDSYYTRFSQNPDMLKDNVGQPRGPSLKELMTLMTAWPQDLGVFLDYLTDPIL